MASTAPYHTPLGSQLFDMKHVREPHSLIVRRWVQASVAASIALPVWMLLLRVANFVPGVSEQQTVGNSFSAVVGISWSVTVILGMLCCGPGLTAWGVGRDRALFHACVPATALAVLIITSTGQAVVQDIIIRLSGLEDPGTAMWLRSPWITAVIVSITGGWTSWVWLRCFPRDKFLADVETVGRRYEELYKAPKVLPVERRTPAERLHWTLRPRVVRIRSISPWVAMTAAVGLWLWSLTLTNYDGLSTVGDHSGLPWQLLASLLILGFTASMCLFLPVRTGITQIRHVELSAIAALATIELTLTANVVDGGAVTGSSYVNVGLTRSAMFYPLTYVSEMSGLAELLSWPGFYTAAAAIAGMATGGAMIEAHASIIGVPVVYPTVVSVLWLPSIFVIGRAIAGGVGPASSTTPIAAQRAGWLTVFGFIALNWTQQEYFSPLSAAMLLFSAIMAIVVSQLIAQPLTSVPLWRGFHTWRHVPKPLGWTRGELTRSVALLLYTTTALVLTQGLVALAAIIVIAGLVILGAVRWRVLLPGALIVGGVWMASWLWLSSGWVSVDSLSAALWQAEAVERPGLAGWVRSDEIYVAVQLYRVVWLGVFCIAALVGWVLSWRHVSRLALVVLVAGPLVMLGQLLVQVMNMPAQDAILYVGASGTILRAVLFFLPIIAALAAAASLTALGLRDYWPTHIVPDGRRRAESVATLAWNGRTRRWVVGSLTILITLGMMFTAMARGVNVPFERTPGEVVRAAEMVLDRAPKGSTIFPLESEGVLRSAHLGEFRTPENAEWIDRPGSRTSELPDYIFLTRQREQYHQAVNRLPPQWYPSLARALVETESYRILAWGEHVIVLERMTLPPSPVPNIL